MRTSGPPRWALAGIGTLLWLTAVTAPGVATAAVADEDIDVVPVLDLGHGSEAMAINDDGVIVGRANAHAARWDAAGRYTDLGTLSDSHYSHAVDVNSHGTVVGQSTTNGEYHLVLWDRRGRITDRGVLPGGSYFNPVAINDHDSVVGHGDLGDRRRHLVRWDHDGPTVLEPPPDDTSVWQVALNNHGMVVGTGLETGTAFSWDRHGNVTELQRVGTYFQHFVTDLADDGTATGYAGYGIIGPVLPLRWDPTGKLTQLDTPYGAGGATDVNRHGVTVGWFRSTGFSHYACSWDAGGAMTHLGTLPGYGNSVATHIADNGTIVGEASGSTPDRSFTRAVRWETSGHLTELGTLGGPSSWVTAVNASGLTVGRAEDDQGRVRAVLWPPVRP